MMSGISASHSGSFRPVPPCSRIRGFSLIEMVAVLVIVALVATFLTPAVNTILRGTKLTQASQMITDQLSLARQRALTKNRAVEVRFLRFVDPESPGEDSAKPPFRAVQVLDVLENGTTTPVDKLKTLPLGVIMDPGTLSSLLSGAGQTVITPDSSAPELPRGVKRNYQYVSFRFQQDGSTNLGPSGIWYVTFYNSNDNPQNNALTAPPANFFTLQIDPVSGATKTFRPRAG